MGLTEVRVFCSRFNKEAVPQADEMQGEREMENLGEGRE